MAWSRAEAGSPGARSRSQYHSAYSPCGANAGTEYTPQWMKMPNFASVHQAGVGRLSTEAQSGVTRCAWASVEVHNNNTSSARMVDPSVGVEHFRHGRPPFVDTRSGPLLLHRF